MENIHREEAKKVKITTPIHGHFNNSSNIAKICEGEKNIYIYTDQYIDITEEYPYNRECTAQ
ncbi:hypothetical protein BOW21_11600 [Solemya velum gill symbiont]|nr:hypothetical protein BOW21_11600 [Solemya velum gill symbiont]